MPPSSDKLYCTFCGKSQDEVIKLIAGPTAFICNECVELCSDICSYEVQQDAEKRAKAESADWVHRTADLQRVIAALSSSDADTIEPIRGPWTMRAIRDTPDGSVNIVVTRRSTDAGEISIAFSETLDDLVEIAEGIAQERAGTAHSDASKTRWSRASS